jgi:hypothetical protein
MTNGETGEPLHCGNNLLNFMNSPDVPTAIKGNVVDFVYTTETNNYLIWGVNSTSAGSKAPTKEAWGPSNVVCIPDEIVHIFQALN